MCCGGKAFNQKKDQGRVYRHPPPPYPPPYNEGYRPAIEYHTPYAYGGSVPTIHANHHQSDQNLNYYARPQGEIEYVRAESDVPSSARALAAKNYQSDSDLNHNNRDRTKRYHRTSKIVREARFDKEKSEYQIREIRQDQEIVTKGDTSDTPSVTHHRNKDRRKNRRRRDSPDGSKVPRLGAVRDPRAIDYPYMSWRLVQHILLILIDGLKLYQLVGNGFLKLILDYQSRLRMNFKSLKSQAVHLIIN